MAERSVAPTVDGEPVIGIEGRSGVTVLCFSSPFLSLEILDELSSTFEALADRAPLSPVVLRSAHPSVFLAGAHLAEIAVLDAVSSRPYADRGRRAVHLVEVHPAPTVAAVHGSCSGGGFDLVLACDAIVASPGASFGHPGIRRGLVTGWTGSTRISSLLGGATARATLLEPRSLDAPCLAAHAVVDRIADEPVDVAIETARRMSSLDPARWELWRALGRPGFIDRFHASVVHKLLQWRICHTSNRQEKSTIEGRSAVANRGRERELEEP
jgi:enoyl-CoA hydratase/carnithine racemase